MLPSPDRSWKNSGDRRHWRRCPLPLKESLASANTSYSPQQLLPHVSLHTHSTHKRLQSILRRTSITNLENIQQIGNMGDNDWSSVTKIGSKVRGPGASERETTIKGKSALNAAQRSGAVVGTEKKFAGSNV